MEKRIASWSYWLGIACLVITLAWKGMITVGMGKAPSLASLAPGEISYWSFYNASILFFIASLASSCRSRFNSRKT